MKSHAPAEKGRARHIRKYAEGALGEDKSFYFRGPANALNLRAQNLTIFMQMADGVDDETLAPSPSSERLLALGSR